MKAIEFVENALKHERAHLEIAKEIGNYEKILGIEGSIDVLELLYREFKIRNYQEDK